MIFRNFLDEDYEYPRHRRNSYGDRYLNEDNRHCRRYLFEGKEDFANKLKGLFDTNDYSGFDPDKCSKNNTYQCSMKDESGKTAVNMEIDNVKQEVKCDVKQQVFKTFPTTLKNICDKYEYKLTFNYDILETKIDKWVEKYNICKYGSYGKALNIFKDYFENKKPIDFIIRNNEYGASAVTIWVSYSFTSKGLVITVMECNKEALNDFKQILDSSGVKYRIQESVYSKNFMNALYSYAEKFKIDKVQIINLLGLIDCGVESEIPSHRILIICNGGRFYAEMSGRKLYFAPDVAPKEPLKYKLCNALKSLADIIYKHRKGTITIKFVSNDIKNKDLENEINTVLNDKKTNESFRKSFRYSDFLDEDYEYPRHRRNYYRDRYLDEDDY